MFGGTTYIRTRRFLSFEHTAALQRWVKEDACEILNPYSAARHGNYSIQNSKVPGNKAKVIVVKREDLFKYVVDGSKYNDEESFSHIIPLPEGIHAQSPVQAHWTWLITMKNLIKNWPAYFPKKEDPMSMCGLSPENWHRAWEVLQMAW